MDNPREATARLAHLLRSEHVAMAEFLVALADFDRRRLWLELGHAGLFSFLVRELRLSKSAAFQRKVAAELLQKMPDVEAPLRDGRLCMTAVGHLAKVLTAENAATVLPRFFGLSSREAEAVAAELAPVPVPPRRTVVTALGTVTVPAPEPAQGQARPARQGGKEPAVGGADSSRGAGADGGAGTAPLAGASPVAGELHPSLPRAIAKPLSGDLRRLHVTVSRAFLDKLERAAAALSHAHPDATPEQILEAGLDLLLQRADRRRGLVERPRKEARPCAPDHVAAHVKREVWARDGGRCQWPLEGGGICGATHRVEFDHVRPRALGGTSTAAGLRLLCATHNALAARQAFGDAWMDQFTARARPGTRAEPSSGPPSAAQ